MTETYYNWNIRFKNSLEHEVMANVLKMDEVEAVDDLKR